jgi:hypothetical protein
VQAANFTRPLIFVVNEIKVIVPCYPKSLKSFLSRKIAEWTRRARGRRQENFAKYRSRSTSHDRADFRNWCAGWEKT